MTVKLKDRELEARRKIVRELAVARMFEGVTQEQMAKLVGTQKPNISRLESGEQNSNLDTLIRYASALNKELGLVLASPRVRPDYDEVFTLKIFDDELINFKFEEKGWELGTHIISVNSELEHLLPLDLEVSDEGVVVWLRNRMIPRDRDFSGTVLKMAGLEYNDISGWVKLTKGLSLNDSYWITCEDESGSFDDYNFYNNRFSERISAAAFTGIEAQVGNSVLSPELSTGGMLRKGWRQSEDETIYLYKGETDGFLNTGKEPFSEYYASQIAEAMGLYSVHYELEIWKGILASKCKLFTDYNTAFVPAKSIMSIKDKVTSYVDDNLHEALPYEAFRISTQKNGIFAYLELYKALGEDFYQSLSSMLVFDALIYNEDRHFGNFGLLRDNASGNLISTAPIFDNGHSLFCYASNEDFEDLNAYAVTRSNPYGVPYLELARIAMGREQRVQLRRLKGFKFKRSNLYNLPEIRLKKIENQLQYRIKELLDL